MGRETAIGKIAAMAQLLDDVGLHDDATVMDGFLEAVLEPGLRKEAGLWRGVLSRLSGWARKILFREYREMYDAAKEAQEAIDRRLGRLQGANAGLKRMLARHELPDWREGMGNLLAGLGEDEVDLLSGYDERRSTMTARLLRLAPAGKGPTRGRKPIVPPLLPEEPGKGAPEEEIGRVLAPEPGEPTGTPEAPIPLTRVKRPAPAVPGAAPETPPETAPEAASEPAPPAEPLPGWKRERFGTSGKHGWEWEWEVSPDNNRLRVPKSQLAAASSGKGKILHRQDGRYRPTGGTASVKLRRLMGGTFWEAGDDPSDPNMAILARTEEAVPFPLSMRQEPLEQARKLKELGKTSGERMARLLALAIGEPRDGSMSEEERLGAAARILLEGFEEEEMGEEEGI